MHNLLRHNPIIALIRGISNYFLRYCQFLKFHILYLQN